MYYKGFEILKATITKGFDGEPLSGVGIYREGERVSKATTISSAMMYVDNYGCSITKNSEEEAYNGGTGSTSDE